MVKIIESVDCLLPTEYHYAFQLHVYLPKPSIHDKIDIKTLHILGQYSACYNKFSTLQTFTISFQIFLGEFIERIFC